jgi:hypothetical protein
MTNEEIDDFMNQLDAKLDLAVPDDMPEDLAFQATSVVMQSMQLKLLAEIAKRLPEPGEKRPFQFPVTSA